ncbi:MAG: hypothetical protein ACK4GC_03925 [Paracoccaceae bacterium]
MVSVFMTMYSAGPVMTKSTVSPRSYSAAAVRDDTGKKSNVSSVAASSAVLNGPHSACNRSSPSTSVTAML